MVPHADNPKQYPSAPGAPAGAPVSRRALAGAQEVRHCPTCGTPLALPWCATQSALLDHVIIAQDALNALKAALEEVSL